MHRLSYKSLLIIVALLLIPIVLLIRINQKGNRVSAAWFDESWGYRQRVDVTNSTGSNQTNYQVQISIGTSALVATGKLQSNCNDIRITDINGNLLNYWIETSTCNTASTKIWPKINSLPTSGTIIYVYYGNSSASAGKSIIGTSDFPGLSCKSILDAGNSIGNSTYWIDPTNSSFSDKFQAYCDMTNDSGGWMTVTQNMINSEVGVSITTTKTTGNNNGVTIQNITTASGCGQSSNYKFLLNDIIPWTQIKTDYEFTGGNSCWGIFGNTTQTNSNLNAFVLGTDTIRNQVKMGGSNGDNYDGINSRCDNETYNFWHSNQGVGTTRSAQVILRRNDMGSLAGLGDGIGCISGGNYGWKYSNTYIRENSMVPVNITSTPASEELSPAPVAYWKFDEGVGTSAFDSSSNKLNGNLAGTTKPVWTSEDQCISGKCLFFNGTTSYIAPPVNSKLHPNSFTISTWVKLNVFNPDSNIGAVIATNYSGGKGWIFYIHPSGNLCLRTHATTNGGTLCSPGNSITLNKWYQISATYNNNSETLYIDGKSVATGSYTNETLSSNYFDIGAWGSNGVSYVTGFLDEVKLFPYARTSDQIKQDYTAGLAGQSSNSGNTVNIGSKSQNYLSDGLIGYWKMDENTTGTGSTAYDSSGNNFNGVSIGTNLGTGKFGNTKIFNGSSDYVDIANSTTFDVSTLTISAWVYSSNFTQNGFIFEKGPVNTQYSLFFEGSNTVFRTYNSAGTMDNYYLNTASIGIINNQWNHITATYDGVNKKIYVNGILKNTYPHNQTLRTGQTGQRIGAYGGSPAYFFNGLIDEIRIYNRALAPNEISNLYNWAPGPQINYSFEEGTGTSSVLDRSGNGNNGTIYGTVSNSNWVSGKFGKSFNFNGSDTYINPPGLSFMGNSTSGFTVEGWINPRVTAGTIFHNYYLAGGWSTGLVGFTGGKLSFMIYSLGYATDTGTTPINSWTHVSLSRDSDGNNKLYKNGILVASNNGAYSASGGANEIGIGRYRSDCCTFDSPGWFNGQIDEVKIYNYARTQKQIVEDMSANGGNASSVGSQIAYYKFDEGVGTSSFDSSPQKNNGTNYNTNWTTDGKINKAITFNGTSSFISANNSLQNPETTITGWFKLNSFNNWASVFGDLKYANNTNAIGFNFIPYSNLIRVCSGNGTGAYNINDFSTSEISLNNWIYGALVYDGNQIKTYINGKTIGSAIRSIAHTNTNVTIGRWSSDIGDYYFPGSIDEVKIYNYALTDNEIKLDYNQGSSLQMGQSSQTIGATTTSLDYCIPGDTSPCSPPIAEYNFEENQGTIANDTSGNNNTGTIYNSPQWVPGKNNSGSALEFNGSSQYIRKTSDSVIDRVNGQALTISAWINPRRHSGQYQDIIANRSASIYNWMLYQHTTDGSIQLHGLAQNKSSYIPPLNKWTFISATVDTSGNYNLYANGQLVQNVTGYQYNPSTPSELSIGNFGAEEYYQGKIDQVRIYNYARTPAQVAYDYNQGAPIAHWKLDECQGNTVFDSSGIGNTGTINIGAGGTQASVGTCTTSGTAWGNGASGKLSSSLNFDGTDDYATMGNTPKSTNGSLSTWVYPLNNMTPPIGYPSIIRYNSDPGIYIQAATGKPYLQVLSGAAVSSKALVANQWQHIIGVYKANSSNTDLQIFLNGVLVASSSTAGNVSTTSDVFGISTASMYSGKIDDIRIYNYALTDTQIKTLYNNGSVTFGN